MSNNPHPLVAVMNHETKGKILVTTESVKKGSEVLREKPLMLICDSTSNSTNNWIPQPNSLSAIDPFMWNAFAQFSHLFEDEQKQFGECFCDVHCPKADAIRSICSSNTHTLDDSSVELLVRVAMVMEFNAKYVSDDLGFGLFPCSCKAAHSCRANCEWFTAEDGSGCNIIQAVEDIAEGEEVTVNYNPAESLLPINERAVYLMSSKRFKCNCSRCNAPYDDTRCFSCATATCLGHCYASNNPTHSENTLTSCNICHSTPNLAQTIQLIANETRLAKQLLELTRKLAYLGQVQAPYQIVVALIPIHPHHFLSAQVFQLKRNSARSEGDLVLEIDSTKSRIEYLNGILAFNNPLVASEYYGLGSALFNSLAVDGTNSKVLIECQAALRSSVRMFTICYGVGHSLNKESVVKLTSVQLLMQWNHVVVAPKDGCSLCGLRGDAFLCCSRCSKVAYCYKEHQRAQWPLHKMHCKV
ncbi:hypothetical protein HK100_012303 [Physocladia obscura]|uniref:MYND-type domain-containing protein n=1 Tax=Physocladia obscura TaxID=109957 RepID=A0AAD5XDE2_9FUNG|nr:hypothetical protein HK100_012303 [Physocladia obscura]